MWRFHPQTDELVRLVREGAVGDVRYVHAAFAFGGHRRRERAPADSARGRRADGRRVLLRVRAAPAVRRAAAGQRRAGDSAATASTSASPASCASTATCSRPSTAGWTSIRHQGIQIVGTEGSIQVPQPWQTWEGPKILVVRDESRDDRAARRRPLRRRARRHGGGDLRPAARRGSAAPTSLGQARAIDALYRSAAEGRAITLCDRRPRPPTGDRGRLPVLARVRRDARGRRAARLRRGILSSYGEIEEFDITRRRSGARQSCPARRTSLRRLCSSSQVSTYDFRAVRGSAC